jgi:hypothetical protein
VIADEQHGSHRYVITGKSNFSQRLPREIQSSPIHQPDRSRRPLIVHSPLSDADFKPNQIIVNNNFGSSSKPGLRVHGFKFCILRNDFGNLVVPVIEKLIKQIIPILEMPIKPALGNPETAGQLSNGNFRHIAARQCFERCLQPLTF